MSLEVSYRRRKNGTNNLFVEQTRHKIINYTHLNIASVPGGRAGVVCCFPGIFFIIYRCNVLLTKVLIFGLVVIVIGI